jgi:sRNA-binding protein
MNIFGIANLPYAKQDDVWREQMKAMRQQIEATTEDAINSLGTATANRIQGAGDLAAKAAIKRIRNEAKAKAEASQKAANKFSVWKNRTPATSVKAGDATVDLSGDTLTLSNGTQIDLKTGLKVSDANVLTLSDGTKIDLRTGQKIFTSITV